MITERLMKPGQFSLQLRPDTPREICDAVAFFDHIVVTPAEIGNPTGLADANILDAALYTGVVLARDPDKWHISGQGLAFWLGDDQGIGAVIDTALTKTAGTLTQWITDIITDTGLTVGTITNTATTMTHTYRFVTRREALVHACAVMGAEWRINPDGTVDAAAKATLFPTSTTPTAIATSRPASTNGALAGIEATVLEGPQDVYGHTTGVRVFSRSGDGSAVAYSEVAVGSYFLNLSGADANMTRQVNAPTDSLKVAGDLATQLIGLYSSGRSSVTLSSNTYAVATKVRVGDFLYVHDLEKGVSGTTPQVQWGGELLAGPWKVRAKAITHPFLKGYGVYARRSTGVGTSTYTDLTPYVQWETGATTWEIGTSSADPDQDSSQLGGAFLGVHPEIVSRLTAPPWITYTPTFTNVTGGAGSFQYQFANAGTALVRGYFTAGTATGAGKIKVSVPITAATIYPAMVSACEGTGKVVTAITDDPTATITFAADHLNANWGAGAALGGLRYAGFFHVA